jgi:pilus assembly protein CpaD
MSKEKARKMAIAKKAAFVTMAVCGVALLGSCAGPRTDKGLMTASIENDYRARHPISMAEAEHSLDLPVASGSHKLTVGMRDTITGFAQDYLSRSGGTMQVAIPTGSINAGAVARVKSQIKSTLVAAGIPAKRISFTRYAPQSAEVSAPVHFSFVAITPVTSECGQWPDDLLNNSTENKNWHNFGCATQNNLAAMIANPTDLTAPRGMTSIDAERRTTVIGLYRDGSTAATY